MKQIILTLHYRHDGQKNMKDMELRILFCWAGNIYNWRGTWPFSCVPSPGDTLGIQSFIEKGHIKADEEDVVFKGSDLYKYRGLEVSLEGLLSNEYNTKVVSVNWTGTGIEIEITTDTYQQRDSIGTNLWEEEKNNR